MPIRFRCQDCSSRVKVPEGTQGKQVKCPRCGRIQSVPHHQDQSANNADLTVHTLVGSMHKAPKRKEALVSSSVDANAETDRYDAYDPSDSGDTGGAVPGGLNIPTEVAHGDYDSSNGRTKNPGDSGHHNYRGNHTMSRKKRRRLEAQAARAKRDTERDKNQARIDASRKQVEDIFAGSKYDTRSEKIEEASAETHADTPAASAPEPITLSGSESLDEQIETVISKAPMADVPQDYAVAQPAETHTAAQSQQTAAAHWTLDLTAEAYPFLKIVPWVLRIAALMLIGPAFKGMLVANEQGFSAVVSMLVLFAGLTLVAVTWTVGEIATAVRDIAVRNATT